MGRRRSRKANGIEIGRKRRLGSIWIGGLALAVVLALFLFPRTSREKPNIVLVSVDTLRADHLSCYGSERVSTPHIDRLASRGVLFEQAVTPAPTTLPAHASLFTGLVPPRHGVRDNVGFYLPEEPPTLASLLREAGYRTGGFVGAFVMDSRFGIGRGFETYFDELGFDDGDAAQGQVAQRRGEEVLERALAWMDEASREGGSARPFFAFLHFYDPHTPYDPPARYRTGDGDRALYRGEVAYVDALVGRLDAWLAENRLSESTLVVLTADHGESLGEHGEKTHGFFLYESTLRIPLILSHPGAPASRIGAVVRLVDVAPTLLDLAGVEIPAGLDGRSLRPLWEGTESAGRDAYAETYLPRLHYGWSELRSLRRGNDKWILAPRSELYDLASDPSESRNLLEQRPRRAEEMNAALAAILRGGETARPAELDERSRQALASLGYAGSAAGSTRQTAYGDLPDPKDRIEVYELLNDPALGLLGPQDGERFQRALASLRAVVEGEEVIPRAYALYGDLLLRGGRFEDAVRVFRRLVEIQPESFSASYGLGVAELATGSLEAAATSLLRAQKLDPRSTKTHFQLAELERRRGDLGSAEEWLRRGLAVHPDRALEERLAAILIEQGKAGEAESLLSRRAEEEPTDAAAAYNLGQALLVRGEPERALAHLERAARLAPRDADVHHALGNALASSGRLEEALSAYRRAIEIAPCFAAAHSNRGTAEWQLGRREQAIASLNEAIRCDPDYATAYANLASVYLESGDIEPALSALESAVRLRPDDGDLARALEELRRYRP